MDLRPCESEQEPVRGGAAGRPASIRALSMKLAGLAARTGGVRSSERENCVAANAANCVS